MRIISERKERKEEEAMCNLKTVFRRLTAAACSWINSRLHTLSFSLSR